jgi:hypothetical protein
VTSGSKQTRETSECGDGIRDGVQGIGTCDQIKAASWKRQASLSRGTNHDLFESKRALSAKPFLRQGEHILTAIDPIEFGTGESLM